MDIAAAVLPRWTLGLAFSLSLFSSLSAQGRHRDYDDVDPWAGFQSSSSGPVADSATVASFLAGLATSSPIVCQMAGQSLGNHWGSRDDDDSRIGVLAGEETLEKQRDALNRAISPDAISFLIASLG